MSQSANHIISIHSTPRRSRSSQHGTEFSPTSDANGPRHQSRLVKALSAELNMHVWGNDADKIAQMLSPKLFKEDGTESDLIDHPAVKKQLDGLADKDLAWPFDDWGWEAARAERDYYSPIASVLNQCVTQCNVMYESLRATGDFRDADSDFVLGELKDRFFEDLFFSPYDKEMGDTIEDAAPMKPDLLSFAGGPVPPELASQLKAFWSLVKNMRSTINRQVAFTVEVKRSWALMVQQIAAYVRAQFAVSPLRCFVPGIGVNQKTGTISIFIFHRGGLTMSAH